MLIEDLRDARSELFVATNFFPLRQFNKGQVRLMKNFSRSKFLLKALAALGLAFPCALVAEPATATEGGSLHLIKREDFPSMQLRGYGKVSGSFFVTPDGKPASLLAIRCESKAKAEILQAKYLSDFGLLPGVKPVIISTKRGAIAARRVDGQGDVAALRSDANVFVLAAQDDSKLALLVEENLPATLKIDADDTTEAAAGVPMYLDRWDRHGLRFYYGPFTTPQGANDLKSPYDPGNDFDFARDEGNCGLVVWQAPFPVESAEGILRTPMWDWGLGQGQKMGLPFGINLSMGVPCSLYNRYREEWTRPHPQYLGGYYGLLSPDEGIFSWNSVTGREAQFAVLQQTIHQFGGVDNIVNWLNPDGEMGHGPPDNLIDYGPTADAGYREFLKSKYTTVDAVAIRWFGDTTRLHSWNDVHVPELASFLGWGKDAIDLTGTWKVNPDAAAGPETAAPDYDDSTWPSMTAPGHAIAILLPHKPAVLRRHITVDSTWRVAHSHVWLYVFDLSDTRGTNPPTRAFLNGRELAEATPAEPRSQAHWAAYDVSSSLNPGDNTVTVDVPQGFFNYRVYFSPQAPRCYPDLGPQLNAQWADFIDWGSWSRANAVRRGAQMIRQADPNRPITFMSPDTYAADIKTVCEDYGGVFHNTGYMAGVWADFHSMEMESSNLPTDLEPGSGAKTLTELKGFLGRWSTEGIQGVDYFQHIGDVEWNPEIKNYFHDTINLWHLIGKYHVPKAQVALLASDRINRLYGFPFHHDLQHSSRHGQWDIRFNELLLPEVAREEVFEQDFDRGNTDAYKVIIDLNTSVMDAAFVTKISKWVQAGGIFITWGQTGRNTSTEKDAWPISKLTGFKVADLDRPARKLHFATGQRIFNETRGWDSKSFSGLTLEKQEPECSDLMQWDDGTTAIGLRPVGKGFVVAVGPEFGNNEALRLFKGIFDWARIERIPATAPGVLMRHFVSNNGLYDIWAMWNNTKSPIQTALTFRNGLDPQSALDVKTGQTVALRTGTDGPMIPVALDTSETRVLLTPRNEIASAPAEWFRLQRNWWRGTSDPGPIIPPFKSKFTLDLQSGWSFKILDGPRNETQGQTLAVTDLDDSSWEKRSLGIFTFPDHHDARHAIFRRRFTVPADWNSGKISLWLSEWHGASYIDNGQAYLDGKPLSNHAVTGDDLTSTLKPKSTHTLAVEIWGNNPLVGTPASVWLDYQPTALQEQDLAGKWTSATDGLTYNDPVAVPGPFTGITLRRTVKIDGAHAGQTAVIRVSANDVSISGVIVNGTWISRFHHHLGTDFDLAITPYLKFGNDNEIILFGGAGPHVLNRVSLDYYSKGTYP